MVDMLKNWPLSKTEIIGLLEQHDIIPTQQRVEIAQVLFARPQHLAAEQVLAQVNQATSVASKATVYNTLGLFAGKGLIREVLVDPTRIFYDPNTSQHHHFYNVDTGSLMDIEGDQVTIANFPSTPEGTVTEAVDIIVRVRSTTPT
ncbi:MAG: Fur family transcriptional regulator [Gammaproteobacteria bacterium]